MAKIDPKEDTIAAISTALGEGAVGIVRISGSQAINIAERIFLSKNGKSLSALKSFRMRYGWIVRDKKGDKSDIIDEVIVSIMRSPKSYTKEDVVEINSHGGPKAAASILDLVLKNGARIASPGEFTKRAFLNGRLDLAQAEAVLDIIGAKSDLALKISQSQLSGITSSFIKEIRNSCLSILADMEAQIDFSEEHLEASQTGKLTLELKDVKDKLDNLLERSFKGRVIREGVSVAICGRPNVGKSSILNALLRQERAIVTPIEGTTRDTIEEFINIKGLAARLIDTAGILKHKDEVEEAAVNRARKVLETSDIVLLVLDGSVVISEEDKLLIEQISGKKGALVVNKCDLPLRLDLRTLKNSVSKKILEISAIKGENIDLLEDFIFESALEGSSRDSFEGVLISSVRHIEIIRRAMECIDNSIVSFKEGLSQEFAAIDLKKAVDILGEVTGDVFTEELLDAIFSKFCVGK